MAGNQIASFAKRLAAAEPIIGTFIKTPSPIICEVLSLTALQACCLDAEHAPFSRLATDDCLSRLRAQDMPSLVRIANDSSTEIRNALDSGATGILVPHVSSADQAKRIVAAAHFGEGGRGYAGSTRAANFTTKGMPDHLADSKAQTTIIVQIEDLAALPNVAEIAKVDGVHALFIGRIDLAVAMGKKPGDAEVMSAVRAICKASTEANTAVGMFTPNIEEVREWRQQGVSFFLLNSDQGFMLQGAKKLVAAFNSQTS